MFRPFVPAAPIPLREPFDSTEYVFELKMDGFRALAHVAADDVRLVSRRGNVYKSFPRVCSAIRSALDCEAVLDGEIVCLDTEGRPQFYDLLRRRGEPVFYVFDVLWLDGADLRDRPLLGTKAIAAIPHPPALRVLALRRSRGAERRGILPRDVRP